MKNERLIYSFITSSFILWKQSYYELCNTLKWTSF